MLSDNARVGAPQQISPADVAGEGKDIELRHQRNPDVLFDCVRQEPGGTRALSQACLVRLVRCCWQSRTGCKGRVWPGDLVLLVSAIVLAS